MAAAERPSARPLSAGAIEFFHLTRGLKTIREAKVPELLYDQKFWLSIFFAAEWAVRLAMIVIVPFRRSPDAAKGWLLLIFFEPTAGLILYLLIGRPTLPVWRVVRHADFDGLAKSANILHPELSAELQHAVTLAENLGDFPILGGNSAEILADYQVTIDRLVADIAMHNDHVHP